MTNLLIGAISSNYSPSDIQRWVESSQFEDCHRILLLYTVPQSSPDRLVEYLQSSNVEVVRPMADFWGGNSFMNGFQRVEPNTGKCNEQSSYYLVHNLRFLHIWEYLANNQDRYKKVLITDVKDVYFNRDPFLQLSPEGITATSEVVLYRDHSWNQDHLHHTLGMIGLVMLMDEPVHNVGVFGGNPHVVMNLCADIYLIAAGKPRVADQTAFNYLINTRYSDVTEKTDLSHKLAVHLHVINEGKVPFDIRTANEYAIIHQWDRIPQWNTLVNVTHS